DARLHYRRRALASAALRPRDAGGFFDAGGNAVDDGRTIDRRAARRTTEPARQLFAALRAPWRLSLFRRRRLAELGSHGRKSMAKAMRCGPGFAGIRWSCARPTHCALRSH